MTQAGRVLVTGASDGIGRETARELSARGWHVLVHGRDEAKANATAQAIAGTAARVTPVWGDFANMGEVVELAAQVTADSPTLDALVNNAGVYTKQRQLTDDGFELTMAVNHFAPFVLTHRLLPVLTDATAGRIVNVSSTTHGGASLDLDDLTFNLSWSGYDAYASSKLANILFTRQLAIKLKKTRVTVNALDPGVIATKLLRVGFAMGGRNVEDGARASVYLTTSGEIAGVSGKYFVNCRAATPSAKARDDRLGAALWKTSTRLLERYL